MVVAPCGECFSPFWTGKQTRNDRKMVKAKSKVILEENLFRGFKRGKYWAFNRRTILNIQLELHHNSFGQVYSCLKMSWSSSGIDSIKIWLDIKCYVKKKINRWMCKCLRKENGKLMHKWCVKNIKYLINKICISTFNYLFSVVFLNIFMFSFGSISPLFLTAADKRRMVLLIV